MSALHTSRAPWWMVSLFSVVAVLFFILAAGSDVGLLPEALAPDEQTTVLGNIRRALMRVEQKAVRSEGDILRRAGKITERAGQRLKSLGGQPPEALPQSDQPAPVPAPGGTVPEEAELKGPGKLLAHTFSLTEQGVKATFVTDRGIPAPKVHFFSRPAIWVIDLPGSWRNASTRINTIDHGSISQVVIGEHHDYLRLSFHFREESQPRPAKSPVIIREGNGFTVIVPPADS